MNTYILYYSKSEHLFQDHVNHASFTTNDIFFLFLEQVYISLIYKVWYTCMIKKTEQPDIEL